MGEDTLRGLYSFAVSPVQMETVTSFSAPDPWNGKAPALMTLSVYRMVNDRYANFFAPNAARAQQMAVSGKALKTGEVLGLRSSLDGRYHMLPIAITRLWQKDRLKTDDLPRIVAEAECGLPTSDYFSRRLTPLMKVLGWVIAGFGGLLLGVAALAWLLGAPRSHIIRPMTLEHWLSHPQQEASLKLAGKLKIDGYVHVGQVPTIQGIANSAYDANVGWYHASDGERLILLESASMPEGVQNVEFEGSVNKVSEVNLPAGTLASIQARVPDLQTRLIACNYWEWEDGFGTPGWEWWLVPGLMNLATAGLLQLLFILRERRLSAQEARFDQRFASAST